MPDAPVNIVFTAVTRPIISLGVRESTSEWRMTSASCSLGSEEGNDIVILQARYHYR